ncbi:PQQ-binding-like beta-propeller repeat protein [bacterium]|nr:PQQ-binding-like beta-propeller repeat protein [bacterium]
MNRRLMLMPGVVLLAALVNGCGGREQTALPAGAGAPAVSELLREYEAPAELDAALADELLRELSRVLAEQGITRLVSAPPSGQSGMVDDLTLDGTKFSWSLRSGGDYDQNGEVNVSDITPIGIHLGKSSSDADWDRAQLADGDANGVVTLADITPVGVNFGNRVDGYELQYSSDGSAGWSLRSELPLAAALLPAGGGRKYFELAQPGAPSGFYRVVPYQQDAGNRALGIPGNVYELAPSGGPISPGNWNGSGADSGNTGYSPVPGPASFTSQGSMTYTDRFSAPLIGSDGNIYTLGADGLAECFTPELIHIWGIDIGDWPAHHRLAADNTVIAALRSGDVLQITGGSEDWRISLPDQVLDIQPVPGGGALYVEAGGAALHRLDATGAELWNYSEPGRTFGFCHAIPGAFCVLSYTGQPFLRQLPAPVDVQLSAVDDTGSFLWSFAIPGVAPLILSDFHVSSYLNVSADGRLLVCSDRLLALNAAGGLAWEGAQEGISGPVSPNALGQVSYATFGDSPDHVRVLDGNGLELFSTELSTALGLTALGADGRVCWQTAAGVIQASQPPGTELWEYTGVASLFSAALDANGNFYGFRQGSLISLGPDGGFRWGAGGSGFPNGSPGFTDDGRVVCGFGGLSVLPVGNSFGTVHPCFDANSGSPWILPDNRIAFLGTHEGRPAVLCCADDGTLLWQRRPLGRFSTRLAMGGSGRLYYGWSDGTDDYLSCIGSDGSELWTTAALPARFYGLAGNAAPAVDSGPDPEVLYARLRDRLVAVDGNGSLLWEHPFADPVLGFYNTGVVLQPDGSVVFDDYSGNLRAVSPAGNPKWSVPLGGTLFVAEAAVAADGAVVYSSTDKHLYVVNEDGTPRWNQAYPSAIFSSACVDSAGRIYFSNGADAGVVGTTEVSGGRTYCLDSAGNELWSQANEPAWEARPAIDPAGRLYVMQKDGTLIYIQ